MEFKDSRTFNNLMAAFAGESQARNKYTFYANEAEKNGYYQIGQIFKETAENERAHAEIWFEQIHEKCLPSTEGALKDAAGGEWYEFNEMYSEFSRQAEEEGYKEIAALFKMVGQIEKDHYERFKTLAENIKKGEVFKKDGMVFWQCQNCGHIHCAEEAPKVCPVCKKPQSYFAKRAENY